MVSEHLLVRDFDMIFHYKVVQILDAEYYVGYFDMIFHYKVAQNLVAELYERYFDVIFHFRRFKTWLKSTMKDILT